MNSQFADISYAQLQAAYSLLAIHVTTTGTGLHADAGSMQSQPNAT